MFNEAAHIYDKCFSHRITTSWARRRRRSGVRCNLLFAVAPAARSSGSKALFLCADATDGTGPFGRREFAGT